MRAMLLALALTGCAEMLPGTDARYTGRVVPESACGTEAPATLVVRRSRFTFTPTDGVLLITGDVAPDGTLAGQLTTPGVDRKPFTMTLAARIAATEVDGTYVTPRCRFRVTLSLR